jgi:hypothetical protein
MRKVIILAALLPTIAVADSENDYLNKYLSGQLPWQIEQAQRLAAPPVGIAVQPVLPVPQDRGPWGTGYSIVTNSRPTRNLWDRDVTGSETVQRVVPNDALGQPIRGLDLNNW